MTKLYQWEIIGSKLSINLNDYYVVIQPCAFDDNISYLLEVVDKRGETIFFDFEYLQSAIDFTEEVINYSFSFKEMEEAYEKRSEFKQLSLFKDW